MIIVPLAGDRVKTAEGVTFKVLSYTNYKAEGPAVIVESPDEKTVETVFFKDILSINDQKVKLIKNGDGYNVFETDGYIKRKFQLPQVDDHIKSEVNGIEPRLYKVNRIRLHVKEALSQGLILDCEDPVSDEKFEINLNSILDVPHTIFNQNGFQTYYSDYTARTK